jgi:hypothetical protein
MSAESWLRWSHTSLRVTGRCSGCRGDSSHHLSNCVSLLLRIAIRGRPEFGDLVAAAVESTITLTQNLIRAYEDQHWDVAGAGLKRIASLLLMADQDLPETKGSVPVGDPCPWVCAIR